MHDLRKQVLLESGKTSSRKARNKQSCNSSAAPSAQGSRVASKDVSDDESSVETSNKTSIKATFTDSYDDLVEYNTDPDDDSAPAASGTDKLDEAITQILNRKRSSAQSRERALAMFNNCLSGTFAYDEIQFQLDELVPAFLKSVKAGHTENETVQALIALALIVITDPDDTLYDTIHVSIKATIQDGKSPHARATAIRTLAIATFYCTLVDETREVMDFFLHIASSDGLVIDGHDNTETITAALQEWGFLASQLDDLEEANHAAMEVFIQLLESGVADVQIAAGENIALLLEKSYTEVESDDEANDAQPNSKGMPMLKRYEACSDAYSLEQTLKELARTSNKRISKKDRQAIHLAFRTILETLEMPVRGPYHDATMDESGRVVGSKVKVTECGDRKIAIGTWSKLHCLNGLKRLLRGGFGEHFQSNATVFDTLSEGGENWPHDGQ